ncbi:ATP phosphoribosyltransferase regulatory subunit [Lichenicola cladoniae]|uniref:ATP phosphoribosyltransferase regulatory subunit n=1 Tax=Lichenicola cladoniae TaxID=1484109 RepID=A0A6M8HQP9_9PROT|nr:ATP phosphoribosyltransferase regulatory subunit [Lichenicola cladoniae]NPD68774.1 ATP phosphoribosyltransferase regulatory subunit [Acetobacteraceae bacterium]QKE90803.1 ATP phosphoribosyltransferase regulatory subunit [Lichenicola cladoniae]
MTDILPRHPDLGTEASPALLPAGLRDLLPPDAESEALGVEALMSVFASHGYERVKPPLLEFEDSLLSGSGAAVAEQTFRLMDPDTHRMMGLRPDMTPQVARIAATRLVNSPRPLRLSYTGACVQLHGGSLSSDRQVSQAGIELIGLDSPEADAEMVAVGAEALAVLGVPRVSFDLTLPPLAPALIEEAGLPLADRAPLLRALDRKDAADVTRYGGRLAQILTDLLLSAGPAARALDVLRAASLSPAARALTDRLEATVAAIEARAPGLRLTVDPIEFRGWRYHTGICVTVYSAGRHEELGRGGRYLSGGNEPACGLTLRTEALLRAAPARAARPRLLLPWQADADVARRLRAEGFATVASLSPVADDAGEARRLGCTHLLRDGAAALL